MTHALSTVVTIADDQADQQWQTSNDADAAVANALADILTVDFSGGNVVLTNDQFSSAMTFVPSGLSTNRDLTIPSIKRALFFVNNIDAADTITVKHGSTSVAVAATKIGVFSTTGAANNLSGVILTPGVGGVGDVVGPASAVDSRIAAFDGTTGKLLKDGGATIASLTATGKQTIYVPAGAMTPSTTNGAATGTVETATNDVTFPVLDFDATTAENAWFTVAMPKGWDEGTVTFQAWWTTSATDTDGVAISLAGVALSDNEALDTAVGTPIVVTDDAQSAALELLVTAESAAVTIAGTPAEGDMCFFRVQRVVSDGNDDMTEDMRLIGIKLFYTTNAANDA